MDLDKESLVHMNDHYQVVYIPEEKRQKYPDGNGIEILGNYEVRNRVYDVVEFGTDALPLALSMAEHWNRIMVGQQYLDNPFDIVNETAGTQEWGMLKADDDEDDGGNLQ